jgi:hypothetical protein
MKRRWLLSSLIMAGVLAVSVAAIVVFRESPSALPFQAVSDGAGGAIVAWRDSGGIRAQHISASGQVLWSQGGRLVQRLDIDINPNAYPGRALFKLSADGMGGAFVTWQDRTEFPGQLDGPPVDLYSQRIGPAGELLWGKGVRTGKVEPISDATVSAVPDGAGGAIFAWNEYRTFFRGLHDDFLRLQKVTPDGRLLWGDEGVLVIASQPYRPYNDEDRALGIQPPTAGTKGPVSRSWPTYTGNQVVAGDGEGGAFAVWSEEDYPSRTHRVYAQRVAADGTLSWPEPVLLKSGGDYPGLSVIKSAYADPRPSTTLLRLQADGRQSLLKFVSASSGVVATDQGALVAWRLEEAPQFGPPQERAATLYIQAITDEGSPAWDETPVIATEKGQSFGDASFASSGSDTVVVWRLGSMPQNAYGLILAQSLDDLGNKKWDGAGLVVFPDAGLKYQGLPLAIGADSGTIVIGPVGKGALRGDMILAQKLDGDGNRMWGRGIRVDR